MPKLQAQQRRHQHRERGSMAVYKFECPDERYKFEKFEKQLQTLGGTPIPKRDFMRS